MGAFELCSVCLSFFIRPQESFHDGILFQYDCETVLQFAQEGCPVCFWLKEELLEQHQDFENVRNTVITATLRIGEFKEDEHVSGLNPLEYTNILRVVAKLSTLDTGQTLGYFEYLLRSTVDVEERKEVRLKPRNDHQGWSSVLACTTAVPKNTSDPQCSETIRRWSNTCTLEHKLCQTLLSKRVGRKSPTRLIDMADLDNTRLVELDQTSDEYVPYVSVSHRWNSTKMPKLTTLNIAEYTQKIDFQDFPRAFKDSLSVTALLGIRYVWIDALCIMEDSKIDVLKEIALMGQIYHNVFCNIGAHAAAYASPDQSVDLFVDRNPLRISMALITVQRKEFETTYCGYPQVNWCPLTYSNLMHRGWVFQERLLSPRSIYFGEKLHWECSELQACETFPRSAPAVSSSAQWGNAFPLRAATLLYDDHRYRERMDSVMTTPAKLSDSSRIRELYRKWLHMIEAFTRCQLTFESDCFPAVSGLAQYFHNIFKDDYFAGLWKQDILNGLIWYPYGNDTDVLPSEYRAPSWSWASVRHAVIFFLIHETIECQYEYVWATKVHDVGVTLSSKDPFGRVDGGFVRLLGPLVSVQMYSPESISQESRQNFRDMFDEDKYQELPRICHYLLLGYKIENEDDGTSKICSLQGLLLELVKPEMKIYRRVGVFHHEWNRRGQQSGPPPVFKDLTTKSYLTQMVTII